MLKNITLKNLKIGAKFNLLLILVFIVSILGSGVALSSVLQELVKGLGVYSEESLGIGHWLFSLSPCPPYFQPPVCLPFSFGGYVVNNGLNVF